MKLYGLKTCDTCRKALKALSDFGHEPEFHDVRADGVTKAYLTKWAKAAGWAKLINKSSTTWRNLPDAEKEACSDEKGAIRLLSDNPTLIKRPVIEASGKVFVGWKKDTQDALLG